MKLRPKLLDLKPGTRIVSNTFTMEDWEADETATVDGRVHELVHGAAVDRPGEGRKAPGRSRRAGGSADADVPDGDGHC